MHTLWGYAPQPFGKPAVFFILLFSPQILHFHFECTYKVLSILTAQEQKKRAGVGNFPHRLSYSLGFFAMLNA